MATLPIIQFTDEGIEKLQYVYFESGSESFIINYTHDEVLKLFRKDFGQSILTPEQIENIRRNKQAKIEAYAQKDLKNPITINYEAFANKKLVGYTLKKAPGRKMHYASELDIRSRIDILKRARDIVLDFHENGIIHGDNEETQTVRIKVTGRQAKYVESLPLHVSQIAEEGGNDECMIFRYRIKPTFDFIQEIFSHADSFEVLEPMSLRNQIAAMVYNMTKYYSNQED